MVAMVAHAQPQSAWVASNSRLLILIIVAGAFALLGAAGLRGGVGQVGALPQPAPRRWAEYEVLPTSHIECTGADWGTRVCTVHNLYVAGTAAFAVQPSQGPPLVLPELRLNELERAPGFSTLPLREVVLVVPQAAAAATLFAASKVGGAQRRRQQQEQQGDVQQGAEDDWAPEQPEQQGDVQQGAEDDWAPEQPEHQDQGGEKGGQDGRRGSGQRPARALWRLRVLEAAVAVRPSVTLTNWFHTMDDTGNVFLRFCKYLGKCSYEAGAATAMLLISRKGLDSKKVPPAVKEMFGCHGQVLRIVPNATLAAGAGQRRGGLVLVRRVVFGVGDEIVHPGHNYCVSLGLRRANDSMLLRQVQFLRQCAGLPAAAERPRRQLPRVVIVNRGFMAGRSILGLSKVLYLLRKAGQPSKFEIEVEYLEGATFAAQARIFSNTDVLVSSHGAATANMIFLPTTAATLFFQPDEYLATNEDRIVRGLPRPWYDVSIRQVFVNDSIQPILPKFKETPRFRLIEGLTDLEILQLVLNATEPSSAALRQRIDDVGREPSWTIMLRWFYNLRPDPELIAKHILEVVELWEAKHKEG